VVAPPAVAIVPGLLVYGLAEQLVSLIWPTRAEELVLQVPAH
jgi:xanthosine utilization system XapX-like protein